MPVTATYGSHVPWQLSELINSQLPLSAKYTTIILYFVCTSFAAVHSLREGITSWLHKVVPASLKVGATENASVPEHCNYLVVLQTLILFSKKLNTAYIVLSVFILTTAV